MATPLEQWRREGKATKRGFDTDFDFVAPSATIGVTPQPHSNSLREFFDRNTQGPGIWKWNHYFDIYDRHFRQFRGQEVHVLEIGVYSGGSLNMWQAAHPLDQVRTGDRERVGHRLHGEPSFRSFHDGSCKLGFFTRATSSASLTRLKQLISASL